MPTSPDLYQQRFDLIYYTNGGITESSLGSMPTWKIRKYYDLLVKRKKDERDAAEAARTGKSPMERQRLRPPTGDETHGQDPALGGQSGPKYMQDRVRREAELAARRAARVAELEQKQAQAKAVVKGAQKAGRPLVISRGRVTMLGMEDVTEP